MCVNIGIKPGVCMLLCEQQPSCTAYSAPVSWYRWGGEHLQLGGQSVV